MRSFDMAPLVFFLLSLWQLHALTSGDFVDVPIYSGLNSLSVIGEEDTSALVPPEVDDLNAMKTEEVGAREDGPEVDLRLPIASANIEHDMLVLKFRQPQSKWRRRFASDVDADEIEKRKAMAHNFMRFGRSSSDFMRLGKRQPEKLPKSNSIDRVPIAEWHEAGNKAVRYERSSEGIRDSRGDNFMRFGRSSKDYMRFGRSPDDRTYADSTSARNYIRFGRSAGDFMRFGRNSKQDFMRFGRNPKQDFMRFGSDPKQDFMRFGRHPKQDFMRFGRDPKQDFMRFGRDPKQDFMRFGRPHALKMSHQPDKNFMRFGRPDNFMRFGRTSPDSTTGDLSNFMRFGKMDQNFMRFGKSASHEAATANRSQSLLRKNDIKEAAKLFHQTDRDTDPDSESNPMDKAIKVLYNKQHQHEQQPDQREVAPKILDEDDGSNDNDAEPEIELDYALTMPN